MRCRTLAFLVAAMFVGVAVASGAATVTALARVGVEAQPSTPAQLVDRIAADIRKWREIIVSAGIKAQ
jgi:4-hydroxy-3-methylbut-2-enyl diphosphate reductase IspH